MSYVNISNVKLILTNIDIPLNVFNINAVMPQLLRVLIAIITTDNTLLQNNYKMKNISSPPID